MKDFCPISLCNVIYKVVSKRSVNRLRAFLDEIIAETQSAFVPRRRITDNVIIVFEFFQHSKNPQDTHCAYKLDLANAYDMVDWRFLKEALEKIGFSRRWT